MSYSFRIVAANKAEAKAAVRAEFIKVATAQACHERDRRQAVSAAEAFIDLVDEEPGKDMVVAMSGHLSGRWSGSDVTSISGAAMQVSVGLQERPAV